MTSAPATLSPTSRTGGGGKHLKVQSIVKLGWCPLQAVADVRCSQAESALGGTAGEPVEFKLGAVAEPGVHAEQRRTPIPVLYCWPRRRRPGFWPSSASIPSSKSLLRSSAALVWSFRTSAS